MKLRLLIFCSIVFLSQITFSQNFLQKYGGIPFTINGIQSISPFNGGIDSPRMQMVDIDGDGDLDLFLYDRDTTLNYYQNIGNSTAPLCSLITQKFLNLPILNWFWFADMDNDGDKDLFSGSASQTIKYFRNIGTAGVPNFQLLIDPLKTNLDSIIQSESNCIPNFADIDGNDNDFDFITGSSSGRLTFYRNIGTPSNFIFQFVTGFFAGIEIIGPAGDPRHGASSIVFEDSDGDSDKDLFWGDLFGHSIYFIKNTGNASSFNWTTVDTTYPTVSPWIDSANFNSPRLYDIDNDGRKDFFVGVLGGSKTKKNFVYYRNLGPPNNPAYTKVTESFITCIDNWSEGSPAFTDIDNDGDQDLFLGGVYATVSFFRNTGLINAPAFNLERDTIAIPVLNFSYTPSFGNLNNDNLKDLVLGSFDGKLRYFRNTGTASNFIFTLQTGTQFDGFSVQQYSAPALVDIDADGDLDMFSGRNDGQVSYWRNNGNATAFNFGLITNTFLPASVGNQSTPTFTDIDNDGDKDLFVGKLSGTVSFYRNIGTATVPNFILITHNWGNIIVYRNSSPTFVDIENDTDKDLFLGNSKGGVFYFENREVIGVNQIGSEVPSSFKLEQNYPNPFNPKTVIHFAIPSNVKRETSNIKLIVFDILGREVSTLLNQNLKAGVYETEWDAVNFPSGVYFYQFSIFNEQLSIEFQETKRMVLLK